MVKFETDSCFGYNILKNSDQDTVLFYVTYPSISLDLSELFLEVFNSSTENPFSFAGVGKIPVVDPYVFFKDDQLMIRTEIGCYKRYSWMSVYEHELGGYEFRLFENRFLWTSSKQTISSIFTILESFFLVEIRDIESFFESQSLKLAEIFLQYRTKKISSLEF
jgi:hypothetical protein